MSTLDYDALHFLSGINASGRFLLVAFVLSSIYSIIALINFVNGAAERKFWSSHPWAGIQKRLFSRTRAGIYAIRHTREIVERGYEEVRQDPLLRLAMDWN